MKTDKTLTVIKIRESLSGEFPNKEANDTNHSNAGRDRHTND